MLCPLTILGQSNHSYVDNLKCEYLIRPIGIDREFPRFNWVLNDTEHGAHQSAYRLKVFEKTYADSILIWDSGKQLQTKPQTIYAGPPLKSFSKYEWQVEVWDSNSTRLAPASSYFETALMNKADWRGEWITDNTSIEYRPSGLFRKEIKIDKPVHKARLYISSGGLHHVTINGKPISNEILNPIFTRYDKRLLYNTYNVDSLIESGVNTIGVELGNGWFNHQTPIQWGLENSPWRQRPCFKAFIRITHTDGTVSELGSDSSWKTHESARTFNSIYLSEKYDFTRSLAGWNLNGFDDKDWDQAKNTEFNTALIQSQIMPPIRVTGEYRPVEFIKASNRRYIYKFPLNMAGITRIQGNASQETNLKIIHSEQLINNNAINEHLAQKVTINTPGEIFQTDIVKVGSGPFSYQPLFNYKGFQFVEVISDVDIELDEGSLTALRVHSDMEQIGSFSTNFSLINKVRQASNNSYLSNMMGYPTDCPQREKNGWTGDAHFISETGLFNYDAILIYEKWMRDHQDAQASTGKLPNIIPSAGWGYDGATFDWTASMVLIPWDVYLMKGDKKILEDNYPSMKRFLDFWNKAPSLQFGIGDWQSFNSKSDNRFTSLAYYYHVLRIMRNISLELNNPEDARQYQEAANNVRENVLENFLNRTTRVYGNGTLTEQSMAIQLSIAPSEDYQVLASYLRKKLKQLDNTADFGVMGSKFVLEALVKLGLTEEALLLVKQTEFPSWGHFIKMGLTTLPEDWYFRGRYHAASLNHAYMGHINAWMFKSLGGISPVEQEPGFKKIKIAPIFDNEINQIQAQHYSPFGKITTRTSLEDRSTFKFEVTIPPGSHGLLYTPEGYRITDYTGAVESSKYFPLENSDGVISLHSGKHILMFSNDNKAPFHFPSEQEGYSSYGRLEKRDGKIYFIPEERTALLANMIIVENKGDIIFQRNNISLNPDNETFLFDTITELSEMKAVSFRITIRYANQEKKTFFLRLLRIQ